MSWTDYVLATDSGVSEELWKAAAVRDGETVLICGAGFDPRTLDIPSQISTAIPTISVLALQLPMNGVHEAAEMNAGNNVRALRALFGDRLQLVQPVFASDPSSQSAKLTRNLVTDHDLLRYSTVILDMSGLPSMVSFSILQLLLTQSKEDHLSFSGNLLVSASEDPLTDARIFAAELEDPETLAGFPGMEESDGTIIWVPILGRDALPELRALSTFLDPDEICAVVPFPSAYARTADNLLLQHREILFEEFELEPRNVFYASESNPFDLYRQLVRLADRYRAALEPLGSTTIVLSEHTSKMLSLGVLLAAHERQLTVAQVRPTGFRLNGVAVERTNNRISTAWLLGDPYAQ